MNQLDLRQIKHIKNEGAETPDEQKEDKQLKLTEAQEKKSAKKTQVKRGGGLKQMLLKKGMADE